MKIRCRMAGNYTILTRLLDYHHERRHNSTMKIAGSVSISICLLSVFPAFPVLATDVLFAVHSFGHSEIASAAPHAELIEDSAGFLYGTAAGGSVDQGTVFRLEKNGANFEILKRFGNAPGEGRRPFAALLEASDGNLYGTTVSGGFSNLGTIFRLQKSGDAFGTVFHFDGTNGAFPESSLLEATGKLYGTTSGGGSNDNGFVFRVNKDGSDFEQLVKFDGTNGANPSAGLLPASDGKFYGTTYSGGIAGRGTIFRLNPDGSDFIVVKSFISGSTNGYGPMAKLVEGTNGTLFGTTSLGGTNGTGTIFSITKAGTDFRVLKSLGGTNGWSPKAGLITASDGLLYGTAFEGGTNNRGVIFRIDQTGANFQVFHFPSAVQNPAAGLVEGLDNQLYGTSAAGGNAGQGTAFKISKDGGSFAILHEFIETGGDGKSSHAALLAASDGRLRGVTRLGGSTGNGTVFSFEPKTGEYTSHWSFDGLAGEVRPIAALTEGTNGALYGVSEFGGGGGGLLFRIEKNGSGFTPLHNFSGGIHPRAPLVRLRDGGLYGSTILGGTSRFGTFYRISADGSNHTTVHDLQTADGMNPAQALTVAKDGFLYGALTYGGGGKLFRMTPDSTNFVVLRTFSDETNGVNPLSPLLEGENGLFYGTTYGGGVTNNAGVIFRIFADGSDYQVLHSFTGLDTDGRHPCGQLVARNDVLYGTTERGGIHDYGTLFSVRVNGSNFVTLAHFSSATGSYPRGGLTLGFDGAVYGTTDQGGALGLGSIFRFGPTEMVTDVGFTAEEVRLCCFGIPGTNYWLERATNLNNNSSWTSLAQTNAQPNGYFNFLDLSAPTESAYYRLRR
jgi:uncharacterized repeat protein (TIGR03803 family)